MLCKVQHLQQQGCVLSTVSLKCLVEGLHSARAKWYELGLQLGLPSGDLDVIQKNSSSDASSAFREMLKQWLAGANPSREALEKALQANSVDEGRLVKDIQLLETSDVPPLPQSPAAVTEAQVAGQPQGLIQPNTPESLSHDSGIGLGSQSYFTCECGKCTLDMYCTRGCPEGSFPYLVTSDMSAKDRKWFESRLQSQAAEIICFFDDVTTKTLESFRDNQVRLDNIKMNVMHLRPLMKPANKRFEWKTIDDCFACLANYWSWFNTRILEQLIKHYGTTEDIERMADYLEGRRAFLKRSIFSIPQEAYGDQRDENSRKLVLKLTNTAGYNGNKSEAIVLDEILTLVCETLPKITHIELLNVKNGCLELTFQIPDQEVPSLSQKQKRSLVQKGVLSITIGDEVYFQNTSESKIVPPLDDSAQYQKATPGNLRKRAASEDCTPPNKTRRKSPRHNSTPAVYHGTTQSKAMLSKHPKPHHLLCISQTQRKFVY